MIKINQLEIENIKRIKAVKVSPAPEGLTIIGGNNNQGKTSVLDSIAWALGGNKYRPSKATRDGSMVPPNLHVVLSNGIVVERTGKNNTLKVTDPSGRKGGQKLLDSFVEEFALDLPKFMDGSDSEKASILLQIIGVEDKLNALEKTETRLYNDRHAIGQVADQKKKFAREQEYYPEAPKEPISASELIKQQQAILARNGENRRKRDHARELRAERDTLAVQLDSLKAEVERLTKLYAKAEEDARIACKTADELMDESTEELEANLANIEEVNAKVRKNMDKEKAESDAQGFVDQYNAMTTKLEKVRDDKKKLLDSADLPLPGLSVEDGKLLYNGQAWDNISGSDQLIVATAIVRKLNPECGFVLLDKLEQMDPTTLKKFGVWLESEKMQAIATRVSTGDECSIIIEDGYVAGQEIGAKSKTKTWKAGEF